MKKLSSHAKTAKLIRAELKAAFPATKFSVTSTSYSGGDSARVSWCNGPQADAVNEIIEKYKQGHFDSMTDCYEYSNKKNHVQVKFVFANRDISTDITEKAFTYSKRYFEFMQSFENLNDWIDSHSLTVGQFLNKFIRKMDLTNGCDYEDFTQATTG